MSDDAAQAERIKQLVELACIARGWSRQALAAHLGRDVSRLVPEAGNPKLDYVMKLADALEWPVGDVAQAIWEAAPASARDKQGRSIDSTDSLLSAAKSALDAADYLRAKNLFCEMERLGRSSKDKANALANAAAAACGMGQYTTSIELATRGLQHPDIGLYQRVHLQVNIAHALLHLWQLPLALAVSEIVIQRAQPEQADVRIRRQLAFAHYVRGFAHLRLISFEPDLAGVHAENGSADFDAAIKLNEELARSWPDPVLDGLASTCRAGNLELDVICGTMKPEQAFEVIDGTLDSLTAERSRLNYWLESTAWWALAGCNVALRSLTGGSLQRQLAVYSQHAIDIAEQINNWAIKERIVSLQYSAHQLVKSSSDVEMDYVLDREDRAMIASVMGRFPHFRSLGWKILDTSRVIK